MIAIVRADDLRTIFVGEPLAGEFVDVPDVKPPQGLTWRASPHPFGTMIEFRRQRDMKPRELAAWNRRHRDEQPPTVYRWVPTLWMGPHDIPGSPGGLYYLVDLPDAWLSNLQNQLGAANAREYDYALRRFDWLRAWARGEVQAGRQRLVKNDKGEPIAVVPPCVISGRPNHSISEGYERDTAPEIADLEQQER